MISRSLDYSVTAEVDPSAARVAVCHISRRICLEMPVTRVAHFFRTVDPWHRETVFILVRFLRFDSVEFKSFYKELSPCAAFEAEKYLHIFRSVYEQRRTAVSREVPDLCTSDVSPYIVAVLIERALSVERSVVDIIRVRGFLVIVSVIHVDGRFDNDCIFRRIWVLDLEIVFEIVSVASVD